MVYTILSFDTHHELNHIHIYTQLSSLDRERIFMRNVNLALFPSPSPRFLSTRAAAARAAISFPPRDNKAPTVTSHVLLEYLYNREIIRSYDKKVSKCFFFVANIGKEFFFFYSKNEKRGVMYLLI